MFDFIRKPMLWEAWDEGLEKEITKHHFSLKAIQDLAVYKILRGTTGMRIAEVGAGNSRVLPALAESNSCVAIEKYEGVGNGPKEGVLGENIETIPAYLGVGDPQLPFGTFDIVYSISVVEHVPGDTLDAFHREQLELLKPGGMFLHAIDVYLDDFSPRVVNRHNWFGRSRERWSRTEGERTLTELRFERYRDWVSGTEGVTPLGPVYDGPCAFSCDLATNPDNNMYQWGKKAPAQIERRQQAQSVSLLLGGRKAATA